MVQPLRVGDALTAIGSFHGNLPGAGIRSPTETDTATPRSLRRKTNSGFNRHVRRSRPHRARNRDEHARSLNIQRNRAQFHLLQTAREIKPPQNSHNHSVRRRKNSTVAAPRESCHSERSEESPYFARSATLYPTVKMLYYRLRVCGRISSTPSHANKSQRSPDSPARTSESTSGPRRPVRAAPCRELPPPASWAESPCAPQSPRQPR